MSSVGPTVLAPDVFPVKARPERIGGDWVPVLKQVPLFEGMSSRHLRRIPARAKRYGPGEVIVRAGDPGNAFYVILDGEVRVEPPRGRSVTLGAGDSFGEMALLDGAPRSADITAAGEVTVMVIGRAAFTKLLRSEPQMVAVLLRTLASRLRGAQQEPRQY
jgi:CRP-like cAMP-binding protein